MPTVNDPNGHPLKVKENGFALIYSAAMPIEAHAGDDGDCYSVVIEADTGAVTCDFFYLKNLSDSTLRVYRIRAKAQATDTEVQIITGVSGNPIGGTELLPVNALIGSGNLADIICEQRAAGDMDLTGGDIFDRLFLDSAVVGEQVYNYSGEIALLKNQALVLYAPLDTTGNVNFSMHFYYHDKVE